MSRIGISAFPHKSSVIDSIETEEWKRDESGEGMTCTNRLRSSIDDFRLGKFRRFDILPGSPANPGVVRAHAKP